MYLWATSCQAFIAKVFLPQMCLNTICDYYSFCRDIAVEKMKKQQITFNATEEITIELQIDESIFGKKCKYNRGKTIYKEVSQQALHKCHFEIVESRDEATLMKIITDHVPKKANVKIVSDGRASYNKLRNLGYDHCVVVHKETFVNEYGHHTNSIESIWSQVKCWFSSMQGVWDKHFDHYLCEFLYRYNNAKGGRAFCWNQLLSDIAVFYTTNQHS